MKITRPDKDETPRLLTATEISSRDGIRPPRPEVSFLVQEVRPGVVRDAIVLQEYVIPEIVLAFSGERLLGQTEKEIVATALMQYKRDIPRGVGDVERKQVDIIADKLGLPVAYLQRE